MSTIKRIKTESVEYDEILRKITSGEWSVVRTTDTHPKPPAQPNLADVAEMKRISSSLRIAEQLNSLLEGVISEAIASKELHDVWLCKGRLITWTECLRD